MPSPIVLVVFGSILAATGQIFLKLGATGASSLAEFVNLKLAIGFLMYALGSVFWIVALSKLPLSRVYPFTVLTFVIVYVGSTVFLGERLDATALVGAVLVLVGLLVIAST